jgi:hypothetical protein
MNLKSRVDALEKSMEALLYQQKEVAILVGCSACRSSHDDEYCEHEQQKLDNWIAQENGGREPDEIIWIVGIPGRAAESDD